MSYLPDFTIPFTQARRWMSKVHFYPVTVTTATHVSLFSHSLLPDHKLQRLSIQFISDHLNKDGEAPLQFLPPNTSRFKHQTRIKTGPTAFFSRYMALSSSFDSECLSVHVLYSSTFTLPLTFLHCYSSSHPVSYLQFHWLHLLILAMLLVFAESIWRFLRWLSSLVPWFSNWQCFLRIAYRLHISQQLSKWLDLTSKLVIPPLQIAYGTQI